MWEPRRLTTLWASTACYRDSFTCTLNYRETVHICKYKAVWWYTVIIYTINLISVRGKVHIIRGLREDDRFKFVPCILVFYPMSTVNSFPGTKRPGRGAGHSPPSRMMELYLHSTSSWHFLNKYRETSSFTLCSVRFHCHNTYIQFEIFSCPNGLIKFFNVPCGRTPRYVCLTWRCITPPEPTSPWCTTNFRNTRNPTAGIIRLKIIAIVVELSFSQ
jgi:hypothetical protein